MKKTLIIAAIAGIVSLTNIISVSAATVTVTKPTIKVETKQEESAVSKKLKEIETAKKDAQEKQIQREKEQKAKQEQAKKDIEKFKNDAKEKQAQREKEQKQKQKQRQDAIKSFKDTLK